MKSNIGIVHLESESIVLPKRKTREHAMTRARLVKLRALEGREVTLALSRGRRIDAASLVSAAPGRAGTVWLFADGSDEFVPLADIVDFFEPRPSMAS
jgi:hypothetical protein